MLTDSEIDKIRSAVFNVSADAKIADSFAALSDRTRFCIFKTLLSRGELCVTETSEICGLSVAAASHHLKILETNNLISSIRDGKRVCYAVRKEDNFVQLIKRYVRENS